MANFLVEKGYEVRSCDIKRNPWQKVPSFQVADLRKAEQCEKMTSGVARVFHFAANMGGIGFITSVGAEVMHDNTLINANMLEASVQNKVNRYLFTSSACVYPTYRQSNPEVESLREEDAVPADPDNFYGWEKLMAEKMMVAYKKDKGLNIRIARLHNCYGPRGTYQTGREKAPAALCRKVAVAKDGESITVWGTGKQTRSFFYIDDCLEGLYLLMQSRFDKPLNLGSDRLVTIDELAQIIINISGKKLSIEHDPSKAVGVAGRNADLRIVRYVLDWEPKVSLEKGLERTYRWIDKMVHA